MFATDKKEKTSNILRTTSTSSFYDKSARNKISIMFNTVDVLGPLFTRINNRLVQTMKNLLPFFLFDGG